MAQDIQTIKKQMADAFEFANTPLALSALKGISEMRAAGVSDAELVELDHLETQIYGLNMSMLSEQTMVDIIENRLTDWLSLPESVDLISSVKGYLLNYTVVEDKNKQRDILKDALQRSNVRLGSKPLRLGQEEVNPTIANWIKVYVSDVGNTAANTVKFARFLAQNPNVQSLTLADRAMLKRMLYFYEFLKLRSDQLAGFEGEMYVENEKGQLMVISDGKVEPVMTKDLLESFKRLARDGVLDRDELADFVMKYPDEFKEFVKQAAPVSPYVKPEDVPQKFSAFVEAQRIKFAHRVPASGVPLPNRTAALVAMLHKAMQRGQESDMVLAKEILQFAFADQERLLNFMRHSSILTLIQAEFPASMGSKNKDMVRQSPVSPMALQALLMIVFKKFGLSEEEIAWQSFDVISRMPIAAKDLKTVVTFDPGFNKLVWRYEE